MINDIAKKLNELRTEENVWIIYLFIIILSFYSNNLERKYFLFNDLESKENYRNTMIIIFTILVLIYSYFTINSYKSMENLAIFDSDKKVSLTSLSFIASFLILISGLIYLYIILNDENIDVEIAFN